MSYTPEELEKYILSNTDLKKSDEIFFELLKRAKFNNLTYTESYFFYLILKASYFNFGKPEDYEVCKEPIFSDLYRVYYKDLHGINIKKDKRGNLLSKKQKEINLLKLDKYFEEWEKEILKTNSPVDQLMLEVSKETRDEIKKLNKKPLFNTLGFLHKNNFYKHKYKTLILRSRHIRNIVLKHIDKHDSKILIQFDKKTVEFNEFSITHIFFRHYAKIMKQTELDKSFHTNEIDYANIGIEIKNILEQIDNSGYLKSGARNVTFKYKGTPYVIWITEKQRSVAGVSGLQTYYRIDTFYPIEKTKELELIDKLNHQKINEEIILLK